ncbi:MAG: pyridoxal-phosphate dependent enzyme [Halieaceae bacterium]|jgi:1-aminocyclopropane-1-carboxylate deaminase|nr:pyridoxal-phosphate dependent enzyme [Halieaceae bacterium]
MLTRLGEAPVAGVSMANVALLRLDRGGGLAPGNKQFKLRANLAEARARGINRLVSFGGAWSNHLHALAAVGAEQGFATVGIVRGDDPGVDSDTLADARRWGMQIVRVSRQEYRRRHDARYLAALQHHHGPCLVIPEGGANAGGARACMAIAGLIRAVAPAIRHVLVPVGTGTTLAGLVAGLGSDCEVTGVAALKGATDLEQRTGELLDHMAAGDRARWRILHDCHCGGFARVSSELREFMLAFEAVHDVALDPVYTGKMLYAVHRRLRSGEYAADTPLLAVHTGGLQGRRGYAWLAH